ncbi:MAG: type II secretion system protein GspC [Myxococcota bacterium]
MSGQRERRIAVGIILGTSALSALFLAQGTTRLVAAALFGADAAEPVAQAAVGRGPAAAAVRDRADPDSILRKNIFDSESGDLTRQPVEEQEELAEEAEDDGFTIPDDPDDVGVCSGGARLVATIVSPQHPDWSFAAVNDGNEALLYRSGMQVGELTLVGIQADRVFMAPTSGSLCKLQMFDAGEPEQDGPAVAKAQEDGKDRRKAIARRLRGGRKGPISDEELEKGVQKVSDTEFNVDQSLVTKLLENQAELMRSARIIPHEQGGRTVGVKLYGIRRSSVLGKLGIQNGDMLRNINGFDMTSPDSALQAYTKLRNADNLTVALERRGESMSIDYNIQ